MDMDLSLPRCNDHTNRRGQALSVLIIGTVRLLADQRSLVCVRVRINVNYTYVFGIIVLQIQYNVMYIDMFISSIYDTTL